MNSGTQSVRSEIWSAISWGKILPPVTCAIISARSRCGRRLRQTSRHLRTADPGWYKFRAEGDYRQERQARRPADDQLEKFERCGIGPMRVLSGPQGEYLLELCQPLHVRVIAPEPGGPFELRNTRVERRVLVMGRAEQAQARVRLAVQALEDGLGDP
jgi:hypothetical protein